MSKKLIFTIMLFLLVINIMRSLIKTQCEFLVVHISYKPTCFSVHLGRAFDNFGVRFALIFIQVFIQVFFGSL